MLAMRQKISEAKAKLLLRFPLFGTLASKLKLVANDDIESFKSNGITLEYNSDFLAKLSLQQLEFVFANGAMHASLAHEARKNGRSGWLWQLATDYAINDMLVQNGLTRPDEAHYSHRFNGLYAEEIYAALKEDILRDELEYEADTPDDVQNQNVQEEALEEQLFEEFANAKFEEEMQSGEVIHAIERFFHTPKKGKINWRDELKAALERFHRDDYTLLPPSKKLLYMGVYLPSCISQRFRFVVAVDSSGSIDEALLNSFLSELNSLMHTIPNFELELLVCDDKIRMRKTFYGGDTLEAELSGGGATDFRPVFELVENELEDVKLLLYFSDLDGVFPLVAPEYEVKWITPKERDVPFGSVIVLED
ncbi:VWA-like domain-containing protein [Sulfurimonas sp.]|uniref:vWA domain-containing protein n=1 Tax=Sulfurimonas sp. TaxID=2022749 RepID=UPI002608E86F|nr:VWA-like domain-containing protein [Sulfurimonas sp.]MDD3451628.1 VWA-like domain-containing protein [Sulfurimonas sp.]